MNTTTIIEAIINTAGTVKDAIPFISLGMSVSSSVKNSKRTQLADEKETENIEAKAEEFITDHKNEIEFLPFCQIVAMILAKDISFTRCLYKDFKALPKNVQNEVLKNGAVCAPEGKGDIVQCCMDKLESKLTQAKILPDTYNIIFKNLKESVNKYGAKEIPEEKVVNPYAFDEGEDGNVKIEEVYPNSNLGRYKAFAKQDMDYEVLLKGLLENAIYNQSNSAISEMMDIFHYDEVSTVRQLHFALVFAKYAALYLHGRENAFFKVDTMEDLFLSALYIIYNC